MEQELPFFQSSLSVGRPNKTFIKKPLLYNLLFPLGKTASCPACDVLSNINMAIVSWGCGFPFER